ncbi:MAG: hypothetical protein AAGU19_00415 [Prolixibacteraceae bacterium]
MKMKFMFSIILLCIYSYGTEQGISKDNTLKNYFSKTEIREFTNLVNYFDQTIKSNYPNDTNSLAESYNLFFKDLNTNKVDIYERVLFKFDQKKILKYLKKDSFDKIWRVGNAVNYDDYQITEIAVRHDGCYMSFLKQYPLLTDYRESIEIAGDISPESFMLFFELQTKLNLNNLEDRLIITVHYLSLSNPPIKRNE